MSLEIHVLAWELRRVQTCGLVKPVNGIPTFPSIDLICYKLNKNNQRTKIDTVERVLTQSN